MSRFYKLGWKGIQLLTFQELVKEICLRPQLFVGRPDFGRIASFLDGYEYARLPALSEMKQFGFWFSQKYGHPSNFPWDRNLLLHCDGNSDMALRLLPILFDAFLAER